MTNENIKVGDIFASNFVYPLFYAVVAKRGKKTVVLRGLEKEFAGYDADQYGFRTFVPVLGKYREEGVVTRRIVDYYLSNEAVAIDCCETAYKWDGIPVACEPRYD